MNQKTQRLATIRKIIRSEMIGSQEELIARLDECGIKITQSTLSRDLKFMNVAKVPHKNKGYIYVLPNAAQHESNISSNISDNITSSSSVTAYSSAAARSRSFQYSSEVITPHLLTLSPAGKGQPSDWPALLRFSPSRQQGRR